MPGHTLRIASYLLLLAALVSGRVVAAAPERAACDAGFESTLVAAPGKAPEANALWLDRRLLRWPGVAAAGHFKLYHSHQAQLQAPVGQRVTGADGALHLAVREATLPPATASRFKWVGAGVTYTYLVDVFVPGVGLVRNRVTDPYSLSLTADSGAAGSDLDDPALKPAGWDRPTAGPGAGAATDMVIYELHVRDFSIGDASVRPAWRGKYLAFTEPRSNGMRHLRALAQPG
jgi:hypothetical protein